MTSQSPSPMNPVTDCEVAHSHTHASITFETYEELKGMIKDKLMEIPLEELTEENVYDVVSEFFRQDSNRRRLI